MTQNVKNRVERWLDELRDPGLPVPGFEIEAGRTAVVVVDPQNDFLHPDGVAWGARWRKRNRKQYCCQLDNFDGDGGRYRDAVGDQPALLLSYRPRLEI